MLEGFAGMKPQWRDRNSAFRFSLVAGTTTEPQLSP
jgi:hypothetical protein